MSCCRLFARAGAAFAAAGFALACLAPAAWADVRHVVARGHTIDAISRRYHVSAKAILDANHIKDPRHLRVGDTLIIPGAVLAGAVVPGAVVSGANRPAGRATAQAKPALAAAPTSSAKTPAAPRTYAARPKTPGLVRLHRIATDEDFTLRVGDRRGRVPPTTIKSFERVLRSQGGQTHPIDARLIALVGIVSDHFGGRQLDVVSGFRPYTPTQATAHSNHNVGHAIDFRLSGVPNEVVRDYCRKLRNTGVGYYPNSTFVHLDTRSTSAFWIDSSKPGEPPKYNAPNLDPDEATSDVSAEGHLSDAAVEPATDAGTTAAPAPGTTPDSGSRAR